LCHRNQAFLAISQQVTRSNGYTQGSAQMKQPTQVEQSLEGADGFEEALSGLGESVVSSGTRRPLGEFTAVLGNI
jgi:hypothetical protein